ncbi:hypothetical protein ACSST1_22200 [Pantoea agglomerans]|nr:MULTISPECIES: hypothetical protein [Pantoea]
MEEITATVSHNAQHAREAREARELAGRSGARIWCKQWLTP